MISNDTDNDKDVQHVSASTCDEDEDEDEDGDEDIVMKLKFSGIIFWFFSLVLCGGIILAPGIVTAALASEIPHLIPSSMPSIVHSSSLFFSVLFRSLQFPFQFSVPKYVEMK
ncbi:hypothetical protein FRACYDRAFT_255708 [Fragilariopsis cylindrus CCMP1102]|uniref:Uncharacterized protein n=1 Tax=Fragilariopsis cylindrus CCMP1102 TaxID=635003 RepID=A0A1E7EJX6_9STRA|nr:hypothetical protein FRACYDRAFT_255708 [Fragilariopsis cylindrus CCMP1102]|eukprot:OEU06210.1 hypothetical protein FRACYDRAFT_255708 [Fragilariopsis cylindrus CCMP1102]